MARLSPEAIRTACTENPKTRERDLAAQLDLTEADLLAAHTGLGATRIDATPAKLIPLVQELGPVLALTRNESAVHERDGVYEAWHDGSHAAMVLGAEIDLRIFPAHWVYGFAVEKPGETGVKCSIQVFDAHGDAVHKIHLRPESDVAAFARLVAALRLPDQDQTLTLSPRPPVEGPKADPAKAEKLRAEWDALSDTHQFLKMTRKLKMNRLGAYRTAGEPYTRPLARDAVSHLLHRASEQGIELMIFVGNEGCIQIHGGPVKNIVAMGPWINVLDPRFDLHLRTDHIAEVWWVSKPIATGRAISVEAFDAQGYLILQIFGRRGEGNIAAWNAMAGALPASEALGA